MKKLVLVLIFAFAVLQLFRPSLEVSRTEPSLNFPPEVQAIVRRSCFDCHSNTPNLRWYDQVMPVYAMVVSDIQEGRKSLNFSKWDQLNPGDQKAKWFDSINQILNEGMPLFSYRMVHPSTRISAEETATLKHYLAQYLARPVLDDAKVKASDLQYQVWNEGKSRAQIEAAPNGMEYLPAYKNWQVISTTDRMDNGTLRAILGNEIAVTAIKSGKTHPYPNGSSFAKIAWEQTRRSDGLIYSGEFKQIEFMVKDSAHFAKTLGWGFARWKGLSLKPYGKDAGFAEECVNCHRPLKDEDYVFTEATNLKSDPWAWPLISIFLNPETNTLSTLYGKGTERKLLSWSEQNDAHWFGAQVPGLLMSTESSPSSANPLLRSRSSVKP